MSKPVQVVDGIVLPSWTDPTAIAAYLTTLSAVVIGALALVHPGFNPPATTVQAIIGGVSLLVAGGAQIVNMIRHALVTRAAVTAGARLTVVAAKVHPVVGPIPVPEAPVGAVAAG